MTYLHVVPPSEAEGSVRDMYDRVQADLGSIPNWATIFSLHPRVRDGWISLIGAVRERLTLRQYELATLAAARALGSSYCALAHGRVLADKVLDVPKVTSIATGDAASVLEPAELAMMSFATKVARNANRVTQHDVDELRSAGFSDPQIFDIAATVAARCFYSTLLDALGVEPDAEFNDLNPAMRDALTVGRPIAERPR